MSTQNPSKYLSRGVSSEKTEVHQAIQHLDKGIFPKAFCKILPDFLGGDPDFVNLMHADGAGTKSSLAYIYWKETGDLSVWKNIAKDALVMNLNDALCVGVTQNILVSSTIGRNKQCIPGEVIKALIEGTEDALEEMRQWGISIILTGGETADVGDLVRSVIVDSTIVARAPKTDIIDNARIAPGQVIVGLSSHGQNVWEKEYNGGMASNGLTSARHDVFHSQYRQLYPESYDNSIPETLAYIGTKKLTDFVETPAGNIHAGKLVLSPTRNFLPFFQPHLEKWRPSIYGMVHCSGGGQTKILHFANNCSIEKELPPLPPLFQLIRQESGTPVAEMLQTFNMGVLMEIYTNQDTATEIIHEASKVGIDAFILGKTVPLNTERRLHVVIENKPFIW